MSVVWKNQYSLSSYLFQNIKKKRLTWNVPAAIFLDNAHAHTPGRQLSPPALYSSFWGDLGISACNAVCFLSSAFLHIPNTQQTIIINWFLIKMQANRQESSFSSLLLHQGLNPNPVRAGQLSINISKKCSKNPSNNWRYNYRISFSTKAKGYQGQVEAADWQFCAT